MFENAWIEQCSKRAGRGLQVAGQFFLKFGMTLLYVNLSYDSRLTFHVLRFLRGSCRLPGPLIRIRILLRLSNVRRGAGRGSQVAGCGFLVKRDYDI